MIQNLMVVPYLTLSIIRLTLVLQVMKCSTGASVLGGLKINLILFRYRTIFPEKPLCPRFPLCLTVEMIDVEFLESEVLESSSILAMYRQEQFLFSGIKMIPGNKLLL